MPGFSGWGEALLGTINYWGGFEDLPDALQKLGYTVIVVKPGPISSNMERAYEIYAQLTSIQNNGFVDSKFYLIPNVHDRAGASTNLAIRQRN